MEEAIGSLDSDVKGEVEAEGALARHKSNSESAVARLLDPRDESKLPRKKRRIDPSIIAHIDRTSHQHPHINTGLHWFVFAEN